MRRESMFVVNTSYGALQRSELLYHCESKPTNSGSRRLQAMNYPILSDLLRHLQSFLTS